MTTYIRKAKEDPAYNICLQDRILEQTFGRVNCMYSEFKYLRTGEIRSWR